MYFLILRPYLVMKLVKEPFIYPLVLCLSVGVGQRSDTEKKTGTGDPHQAEAGNPESSSQIEGAISQSVHWERV